jgi:hypothetical protein
MSRPKSPVYHAFCFIALCIILAGSFSACSNGSSQQSVSPVSPSTGTGGVAFRLVWQQPLSGAHAQFTPPFDACVDRAINTISATVSDGTTTFTGGSWPCSAHEGFITGIPAGTNYTVQVNGISSGLTTIWSGAASPIIVTTGQITDAGTIFMGYVGEASAQPTTVTNIIPNTWNFGDGATTVPVTDRFIVAFNKPMAISTLTTTNMTLKLTDNSVVSATVSYNGANNTAAIIPSAPLEYDTQYVLQVISCVTVTSCILDTTGSLLQLSDYTNTFTTESAPVAVPDAPSGITATPGNGQVRLDWLAVNGATSYNVHYGLNSGIYDRLIPDARAPFVHLGLANNQPYYYIVTAVNGFGESGYPNSGEVSATPVFPTGNPLPPASLTVAPVNGQDTVTWDAVAGATSYNLYWSNTPITPDRNSADNVIRNVASPYIHMNLTDGQNYCYIITALNSSGESADSIQACGGIGGIQIIW